MTAAMALVVGGLYACAVYMLLRRSPVKLLMGLYLLGHAANLLLFAAGGFGEPQPPLVAAGETVPPDPHADPIPQALILTAIVIGFGVVGFALVLVHGVHRQTGISDFDDMRSTE